MAVACGDSPPYRLTLKDIEAAGALSTAAQRVQAAVHEASVMGSSRLSDTPVSFDRWCAIVRALDAGRDPALEPQEADALVKRNIVERTYRLGVKS